MSQTILRLLMSDGALTATFSEVLTTEQYAELRALVEIPAKKEDLRLLIEAAAELWGVKVEFETTV